MNTVTKDYKDFSFNELHSLIKTLYQEIDRFTAERNASNEALNRLANNVQVSNYSIDRIKEATKKATLEALEESKKIRVKAKGKTKKKA